MLLVRIIEMIRVVFTSIKLFPYFLVSFYISLEHKNSVFEISWTEKVSNMLSRPLPFLHRHQTHHLLSFQDGLLMHLLSIFFYFYPCSLLVLFTWINILHFTKSISREKMFLFFLFWYFVKTFYNSLVKSLL